MLVKHFRRVAAAVAALLGQGISVTAEENHVWFFRVVSQQPVQILSINRPPTSVASFAFITWSNAVAFATAQGEIRYGLRGSWHTNAITRILQSDGHVVSAWVSLSYVPGQIIVGFQETASQADALALLNEYELAAEAFGPPGLRVAALVKVSIDSELLWCSRMITNAIVKYAHPNYIGSVGDHASGSVRPKDNSFGRQK